MTTLPSDQRSRDASRIASDLHDDVLPALWAISLRAKQIEEALDAHDYLFAREATQEIRRATAEVYEQTRRLLSAQDRAEAGDDLRIMLLALSQERAPAGAVIEAELDALPSFSPSVRHEVYLIAREALRNVERHADAARIRLRAFFEEGCWVLLIQDDGKGIDGWPALATGAAGFGMRTMRRRAASVGGRCTISPSRDGGTTVRLEVPIELHRWRSD